MKTHLSGHLTGLAVAALLVAGSACASFADDTPAPAAAQNPTAAQTPAAQPETPPPSVPRPSLTPKTAEPAAPAADAEPLPPHRRYAHHHRHWRTYRTAYWEPFPILWPHFYHSRIHWNRIPWFVRF